MSYFIFSTSLTAITSALVLLFILVNKPRTKTNIYFACYTFFVALWGAFQALSINANTKSSALLFMQLCLVSAFFIASTVFHFTCHLVGENQKYKNVVRFSYLFSIIMTFIAFTPLFIYDEKPFLIFNFWPVAGRLFIFFALQYFILIGFSIYIIYKKLKSSTGIQKQQLKHIFYGLFIAYLGGGTNFPSCYGFPLPPIGNILIPAYCIFITYAIYKYQLMDIKIVLKKSLVYTLLITSITLLYLLSIYFTENLLKEAIGYRSVFISMVYATIIAIIFIPLKNIIQSFIENNLFKGTYVKIAEENEKLRNEVMQTERLKSIAILASGLAHEIKNPLTPLKVFSEHLPNKLDDKEFLLKFSKIITKEVDRIDDLVHEMLDFAKPSLPELKPTRIHELINSILELLNNAIIKNRITVTRDFTLPFDYTLNIDPKQIKQALLNILLNAIEAMPSGGQINVRTQINTNDLITIIIDDNGPGINEKDLPHIFDPFFTKKDTGTGLGLSITHEIIKNHHGRILVDSALNKGTTFHIQLPY